MKEKKKQKYRHLFMLLFMLLTVGVMFPATSKTAEAATNGFRVVDGSTYYYVNGKMYTGWLTLNGEKYYFYKGSGKMATGWVTNSAGDMRYFYKGSGKMATGWVKNTAGAKRYFYKGSGIMATGWVKNSVGKRRYFYNGSGIMATGWVRRAADNAYRYFDLETGIMYTGFSSIGEGDYYFDTQTGVSARGFLKINGSTYYFQPEYGNAAKGWLTLDGNKYYFSSTGVMYRDTTATIDGNTYDFDEEGVANLITTDYLLSGNNVYVTENGRRYSLVKEFLTHPGIADGTVSDLELLAALCECEAGGQGLIGMEAVALCLLNRTICPTREFPSSIRYAIYNGTSFPQYSPVRDGSLLRRLNGFYYNKPLAMEAASRAMKMISDYVNDGTKRTLEGFPKDDFDYLYFMGESAFWSQRLDFDKVEYFLYVSPAGESHMFFVDWISPS